MNVYNYHPYTHEYTGCSEADPDPLDDGKFLIPANATTIAPLDQIDGKMRVFDSGVWIYVDIPEPEAQTQVDPELVISDADRRKSEILLELSMLDVQSIRPLRAKLIGNSTEFDDKKLSDIDCQATLLRVELASLASDA